MTEQSQNNYIVYEVLYNGIPVYIGSGKQYENGKSRLDHVKSGSSHNAELNKLFFNDPDHIVVQILRDNLTKQESLELEKEYIMAIYPKFNIALTKRNKRVGKYWK